MLSVSWYDSNMILQSRKRSVTQYTEQEIALCLASVI